MGSTILSIQLVNEPLPEPPLGVTSHAGLEICIPLDSALPKKPTGFGSSLTHSASTPWFSAVALASNSRYGTKTSWRAVVASIMELSPGLPGCQQK
eukprot:7377676-Prymnesium_polylepis.2